MDKQEPSVTIDVLVLDAEARSALACIRSLGGSGLLVTSASSEKNAIGFRSRYSANSLICPSPSKDKVGFMNWVTEIVTLKSPKLLLPCSDLTLELCTQVSKSFPETVCFPFVDTATLQKVVRKEALLPLAESSGIKVPKTVYIPKREQRNENLKDLLLTCSYPAVLKPAASFSESEAGTFEKLAVFYPKNAEEALSIVSNIDAALLLQQRIVGLGVGVFALCKEGKSFTTFCHQRLLEKPPSGGRSVLSMAIATEKAPFEEAKQLLLSLRWTGPAMVEFKQDTDGTFYLMEINPRFWGSLQLSVYSGADFPLDLYRLFVLNESLEESVNFKTNTRLRWILGTLDHAFIRCKKEGVSAVKDIFGKNSLKLFSSQTHHDVFRLNDLKPFLQEMKNYLFNNE